MEEKERNKRNKVQSSETTALNPGLWHDTENAEV